MSLVLVLLSCLKSVFSVRDLLLNASEPRFYASFHQTNTPRSQQFCI